MPFPTRTGSVLLTAYNREEPWEAVECHKLDLPQELGANECIVAMQYAPINPADVNVMQGVYFKLPKALPAVSGMEGCGQVIAKGESVENFEIGDVVVSCRWGGTFTQYLQVPAEVLKKVPVEVPAKVAATLSVNPPTAFGLLTTLKLEPGSWIIQNAGNSGVGLSVIHMAKALGVNVVSLVRREEAVEVVKEAGGEHVFVEGPEIIESIHNLVGAPIVLGLNGVGGISAQILTRCLAPGATLVTYGQMSKEPVSIGGGQLIFKDLKFRGFHVVRWMDSLTEEEEEALWKTVFELAKNGSLQIPIEADYKVENIKEAVQHACTSKRNGKILIAF